MAKVVFMGTPEFAVPSLNALMEAGHQVAGVFTQPDRPVGRGHKLAACPVKQRAEALGIPVFQYEKIRCEEGVAQLRSLQPDVAVTAAFGQILTQEILDIPKHGVINVHASLLPRHRGSAPIHYAILMGDTETGVTLMQTERGLDTGPMFTRCVTPIGADEDVETLTERLSQMGAGLLRDSLEDILSGKLSPVPQDESEATYEPMLKREMGQIDWQLSAGDLVRRVRALNPWPGVYTECPYGRMKVYRASALEENGGAAPGTVLAASPREGLTVACGEGALRILELQLPNAKRMAAGACLAGKPMDAGTLLGVLQE